MKNHVSWADMDDGEWPPLPNGFSKPTSSNPNEKTFTPWNECGILKTLRVRKNNALKTLTTRRVILATHLGFKVTKILCVQA